ncbi:MAG: type II and III secretion system protein, partial [Bryobacter sp.]|nr:type II and III secretion system protein [Bryobacter sp.]
DEEVSLEIESEYKVLTGQTSNDIPVIANRKFNSRVRLKQSEWAVVTGLASSTETRSILGIAGLVNVPIVGQALASNTRDKTQGQMLLVIRPRILAPHPSETPTPELWIGSEARLRTLQ